MSSYKKGQKGEAYAVDFLQQLGYTIKVCNFRVRGGEIDIIAMDADTLVFIEVKLRKKNALVNGTESISPTKAMRLYRTAERYIDKEQWQGNCRFDVVAITETEAMPIIEHLQQAFDATYFS